MLPPSFFSSLEENGGAFVDELNAAVDRGSVFRREGTDTTTLIRSLFSTTICISACALGCYSGARHTSSHEYLHVCFNYQHVEKTPLRQTQASNR
jgi:hypothetical protein